MVSSLGRGRTTEEDEVEGTSRMYVSSVYVFMNSVV